VGQLEYAETVIFAVSACVGMFAVFAACDLIVAKWGKRD
jgi:hypothetical protein